MSESPPNGESGISQVAQMPIAAPLPRDWRGPMRALGVVAALAVIVAAALVVHARLNPGPANDPVRGQQILARAEAANLQDTAFTVGGTVGADLGTGGAFDTPLTGNGEETHQPQRVHLALSAQSPLGSSLAIEVIQDGTTLYTKIPLTGSSDAKPWTKTTDTGGTGISGIAFTQFLDYRYIQHPLYIGDETIGGKAAYHIHADLSSTVANAVSAPTGTSTNVTEDLWFSQSTYFPLQITLHVGANGGASTATVTVKADETFTFTSWNTGLTIALPPPDQVQGS